MRFSYLFPDRVYLRMLYRLEMGKKLHLNTPVLFSEKIQWLKLNQKDEIFTQLVDKLAVKEHISRVLGSEYICPVLKVWDNVEDIDFDTLPRQFVLKTSHGGGNVGVVVCHDKQHLDQNGTKAKLKSSIESDIYSKFREWPYKNVPRRIFAEQYLGKDIDDYKFYCCDGEVVCILLCRGRQARHVKYYFFDKEWNICPYNKDSILIGKQAPCAPPDNLDSLLRIASELSKGFPFVRIDLYDVNNHIYFGEYTFYPASGLDPKKTDEFDKMLGEKIHLNM